MEFTKESKQVLILRILAAIKERSTTKAEIKAMFDAYRPYEVGDEIPTG